MCPPNVDSFFFLCRVTISLDKEILFELKLKVLRVWNFRKLLANEVPGAVANIIKACNKE